MINCSIAYRNWLISVFSVKGGWRICCLSASRQGTFTDGEIYSNPETAIAGAKAFVNRAIARYVLADALLELYEAGNISDRDCHALLGSLGYC